MGNRPMTHGEAVERLSAYMNLHGKKLDAPWRKNPNLNLRESIKHWIEMLGKKPPDQTASAVVQKTVKRLTADRPPVARVGGVALSQAEVDSLLTGELVVREVVPGVVARITIKP